MNISRILRRDESQVRSRGNLGTVHFSSRVDSSQPNDIIRAQYHAREHGLALHNLNDSNPTHFGLSPKGLPGDYAAEPRGPKKAREALAEFLSHRQDDVTHSIIGSGNMVEVQTRPTYCQDVNPDNLYLLSSTSQAYSWLFKLLCNPGDVILAPMPGYPLIESIARLECAGTLEYTLRYDGSWYMDMASIRACFESELGSRIRAIVAINPNNPTGSYVKPEEREQLIACCVKHHVALIVDEVFFDFPLNPFAEIQRFAGEQRVLTFALDGFSKMLAAPQAKVGWIQVSGPEQDVQEAQSRLDNIADDYLPMSSIIAEHIPQLLEEASEQTHMVRNHVTNNLNTLKGMLERDKQGLVSVLRAEGGWNVLLRIPETLDEDDFILTLIQEEHRTGQPGYFFNMPVNGYLAVSLLPPREEFIRNIEAVLRVCEAALE